MPNVKSSPYILKANKLETQDNKTLIVDKNSTNEQYPSAKAVYDATAGQKTAEGGEIFNNYEKNKALGEYSHSEGINARSGSKAFTVLEVDAVNRTYKLDSVNDLAVGDVYSVQLHYTDGGGSQAFNVGKIENIDAENNIVTVNNFHIDENEEKNRIFVKDITPEYYLDEFGVDGELNTFRILAKPDIGTRYIGGGAHSEGYKTQALAQGSHAEGDQCVAAGGWSHTEGKETIAYYGAHAEGKKTTASGFHSHTEGVYTESSGWASHAEGAATKSIGSYSHAEGNKTEAKGNMAHAEGENTIAEGLDSHAEGKGTLASGNRSHAEGQNTKAEGHDSHAGGVGTKATADAQTAVGKYNVENPDALYIVGNGTSDTKRNNAFVVKKDGTAEIDKQGDTDKSVVNLKYANETYANAYKISEEKDIVTLEDASSVTTSSITVVNNAGKSVTLSKAKFVKVDIIDSIDFNKEAAVLDNFTKVETGDYTFDLEWNEDDKCLYIYNNKTSSKKSYISRDIEVETNSDYCLSFDFRQNSTAENKDTMFDVFGITIDENGEEKETQFERIDNIETYDIGYITGSSITLNNSTSSKFAASGTKTKHERYINTFGGTERAKMTFSTGPSFTKIRIKYYPSGPDRHCYISNWRIFKMTEIEGLNINSNGSLSLIPDKGVYSTDTAGLDINYSYTKDTKALIDSKANVSDLYIEEEATPIADGLASYYLPNVKGDTSITAQIDYFDITGHSLDIYGTNLVKPKTFNEAIYGVTFTNREDGGIDIKGTATRSSMVKLTEDCFIYGISVLASGVGLYCYYGYDEVSGVDDLRKITENGLKIDPYSDYSDLQTTYMAFKIQQNSSYDLTVYPMISLGFEKKEFEPYKEKVRVNFIYDENEIGTLEYKFDESGNYTIIEEYRDYAFECSNYTKVVDRFLPNEEKKNLATKEELAEAQRTGVVSLSSTTTTSLKTNMVYREENISESVAFVLPTDIDDTILNSIELQVTISNYDNISIDLGTTKYFGDIPELGNGDYIIYYEHNGKDWCVGALNITSGE